MKIAFVTGCLEPGRDGVGDYTATLARECARRGHAVRLLSLAERDASVARIQTAEMLRLTPPDWSLDNGAAARAWLDSFGPDWVSLQFVPYSYSPRGLFRGSVPALANITSAAGRRHVFFHELWIGSQRGAAWKSRAVGWGQKRAIAALLRRLAPAAVHTSTAYYRAALATLKQPAGLLRMFGSVPYRAGIPPAKVDGVGESAIVCGHFGTLHPNWEAGPFLADLLAMGQREGRPVALVAAGSLGYGADLFARLAKEWLGRITFVALGSMSAENLTAVFARFDFAVTSVPWNILGKSSSAAALREHGVRVLVTSAGDAPRFSAPPLEDAAGDEGFMCFFRDRTVLARAAAKTPPRAGVIATGELFLADVAGTH